MLRVAFFIVMFNVNMLKVDNVESCIYYCYAECHYAEFWYAECRGAIVGINL
jgi:hypothetical protein